MVSQQKTPENPRNRPVGFQENGQSGANLNKMEAGEGMSIHSPVERLLYQIHAVVRREPNTFRTSKHPFFSFSTYISPSGMRSAIQTMLLGTF